MVDKTYVENHIKSTALKMNDADWRSAAVRQREHAEFNQLVHDAAQLFGISDVSQWAEDLGVAHCM